MNHLTEDEIWKDVYLTFKDKYEMVKLGGQWAVMIQYRSMIENAPPFDVMLLPDVEEVIKYTLNLLTSMGSYTKDLLMVTKFEVPKQNISDVSAEEFYEKVDKLWNC